MTTQTAKPVANVMRLMWIAALCSLGTLAFAQEVKTDAPANAIQGIDVSTQNGKVVLKVTLKQPLAAPPIGFNISNPPRIALDFSDTANALSKSAQTVEQGPLRSINVVQAGARTRMVLNLTDQVSYDTKIEGNTLLVTLQGVAAAAGAAVTTHFAEAPLGEKGHSIRDIDFRRGPTGEGKIEIDLSDNTTGIDIKQQGTTVVVDLIKTSLPKNLQRRLDVVDFATPVETIDVFTQGENVRMVVKPKGLWEQSAYQTDNKFILEIRPVVQEPGKEALKTKGYTGEKLSLNFQNVEVRAVLQVIADFTGLNIITSDTVGGNLTLRLKDVPWDQALDIILQSKNLDLRKNGNVVLIAPRDELAAKEKLDLEARNSITDLEPVVPESIRLNYQKAVDIQKILSDPKQPMLSKRGSVVIDARTNTIFVQDTSTKIDQIRQLIAKIDIPVEQVMIEARIVEATDNFSKNLGVRLGIHDTTGTGFGVPTLNQQRAVIGGSLNDTGFHTGQSATTPIFPTDPDSINLPAAGIGGFIAGQFSLILMNQSRTKFLDLELSALEADGLGKTISSPRLVTANGVEATIQQGQQIPYQAATSSGATSVSFQNATLSLKVTPQITPDGNIIMTLDIHDDTVGQNTNAGPAINTKEITTQVLVENGGTVVIGGIYIQTQTNTVTKVPFLGDLPVVGNLFKNTADTNNKDELLIFITPRVVKNTLTGSG